MKLLFYFSSFLLIFYSCERGEVKSYKQYLNHNDTVKYVGKNQCKLCHMDIYNSFVETGMGSSISSSIRSKSNMSDNPNLIYDSIKDLFYKPYWLKDSLWIKEFRLLNSDTVHLLNNKVNYIIGSGHHTNSHLFEVNGYVHQMPYTYYTQDSISDLPPGFENGNNSRFTREINMECMTCHNAYPEHVDGSNNKYNHIPQGIDCERCHGPGEIHVKQKLLGEIIDTSKYIDYSIVNPSKLPLDLQFDICQRCHLQGTAILHQGKSFTDFKPGEHLEEIMDVYLPRFENDNSFIMASHVDRLKQSECFNNSDMTCVSCHNPHKSVQLVEKNYFDKKCMDCHNVCRDEENVSDCFVCHMPKTSSIDIPHVSISDHKIAIPNKISEVTKEKIFIGLVSINNNSPTNISRAMAYLKRYESFEKNPIYLDSAYYYLNQSPKSLAFPSFIQYYYLKKDYYSLINFYLSTDTNSFVNYTNEVIALSLSRTADAYLQNGLIDNAKYLFKESILRAPFIVDFKLKLVSLYINSKEFANALILLDDLKSLNPRRKEVFLNYGFLYINLKEYDKAKKNLLLSLKFDPDYLLAYENLALLCIKTNNIKNANSYLLKILEIAPNHKNANLLMKKIN